MSRKPTFVVVGAGLTGGAAVTTLRSEGFDGRIVLIGQEPHPPYERPPLSKEYLRGEASVESTWLRPPSWYQENDIDLRLGALVTAIDPGGRAVELAGGERIGFDRAMLATGGRNRRLEIPGADLEGVLELRTLEDADRIRAQALPGRKSVVVGAGFIGCEVAASLRMLGVEVEVVEIFEVPLLRVVGPEVGRVMEGIHRDHGVRFHFEQVVERFEGRERVEQVVTGAGARIGCDFAVVGVGILPNADLAAAAGVPVDNGVLVDARCQTAVEGLFAAGDVANHLHPLFGRRLRVEHYDNALKQGAHAARAMLGNPGSFDDPHWFWSDQYEHNLQYVGYAPEWDELVVRGTMSERSFVAFYLSAGLVRAAVGIGRGREVRRAAGLVRAARPVDPAVLRDEDVDLKKLATTLAGEGATA